jgi:hypothetical protein
VGGVTLEVMESYPGEAGLPEAYRIELSRGWWLDIRITGEGRVISEGAGIECRGECSLLFGTNAEVVLEAQPAEGLAFAGWGGVCKGSGSCLVILTSRQAVFAEFVPPLVIGSGPDRPNAVMGAPYEDRLEVTGGTGTQTWSLSGGSLPEGLSLDPSLGTISGIPEESGEFEFQLSVAYKGLTATGSFHLEVETPALSRQSVIDELLAPGSALDSDEQRYLDLMGNRNGRLDLGDVLLFLKGGGQ